MNLSPLELQTMGGSPYGSPYPSPDEHTDDLNPSNETEKNRHILPPRWSSPIFLHINSKYTNTSCTKLNPFARGDPQYKTKSTKC